MLFKDINEFIKNDELEKIKKLPEVSIINQKQENLLHSSAKYNKKDISKYLLCKKLNPNKKDIYGRTPFSLVCAKGDAAHVETFLLYDVDINTQDEMLNTPLHYSIEKPDVINILLSQKANPYLFNTFDETPISLSLNKPKSLEVFLKNKVNPNTTNKQNKSLLHQAIEADNLEIAEI